MVKDNSKHIEENVILFDGVCNLCNGAVNFIIDRDKRGKFKFASLQSEYGQGCLERNSLPKNEFESILYLENDKVFTSSTAVLKIVREMSGLWPILYGLIIIPKFIRDAVYNFIANNRYRFFGKRDECRVPTPGLRARFLG